MMRKIHYVTGSRADFGLMEKTLTAINNSAIIDLEVIVIGQHLLGKYGHTISDIKDIDLKIAHTVETSLDGTNGIAMSKNFAKQMEKLSEFWVLNRPDLVVVLGDRGEMLAATLAAIHLGIHLVHIHGGELSGTIDESFRHAISKLSHFHLTSSEDASTRLRKMGEMPETVFTVGAPGLASINENLKIEKNFFAKNHSIKETTHKVVCAFHPVFQEMKDSRYQISQVLAFLHNKRCSGILISPNSDAGGEIIQSTISKFMDDDYFKQHFKFLTHLSRPEYLTAVANSDLLVGNSSSGIIESASLGVAFVNIGSRQKNRLRNSNVFDCATFDQQKLSEVFENAIHFRGPYVNLYAQKDTVKNIVHILETLDLDKKYLSKLNGY